MKQSKRSSTPLTDFMYSKASRKRIPLSGTFELSPICNFNCKMCYVRKSVKEVNEYSRPMVTIDQWIEIAKQAKEDGLLFLLLTGGEPLLWPEFWELYETLVKMGFLVSINTNGSLIDEEAVERFRKYPPKRINITLYGANDETYERLCGVKGVFTKVKGAIERLKEARIPVKLSCSLTPDNEADLEEMVIYAQNNKLILQVATYMFPPIRRDEGMVGKNQRFTPEEAAVNRLKTYRLQYGEEAYQNYLDEILRGYVVPPGLDESCIDPLDGKIRCRAGKASFWITWDGWLSACGMMPEPKVDLYKESFESAWKELVQECEIIVTTGVCKKCPKLDICHPCGAMAMAETGNAAGIPKYLCELTQEMQRIAAKDKGI